MGSPRAPPTRGTLCQHHIHDVTFARHRNASSKSKRNTAQALGRYPVVKRWGQAVDPKNSLRLGFWHRRTVTIIASTPNGPRSCSWRTLLRLRRRLLWRGAGQGWRDTASRHTGVRRSASASGATQRRPPREPQVVGGGCAPHGAPPHTRRGLRPCDPENHSEKKETESVLALPLVGTETYTLFGCLPRPWVTFIWPNRHRFGLHR